MSGEFSEIEEEIPLEYQVFALAFQAPGAIEQFHKELPAEAVGAVHGQVGLSEFYLAMLDFYTKTGLDPLDPIAFRSWLEQETEIYQALGGPGTVSVFMESIMGIDLSTPDSVVALLKYRAKKRKQLNFLQELQGIVTKKTHKSDEDKERINFLANEIRQIESDIGFNPFSSVLTGEDMALRADNLWDLPDFLPTQFKSLNKALGYTEDGGFCKGAVHAIIAASGKGKSTFVKTLANHWLDEGYRVLYINYEEAISHWERILLTQITGKNVYMGLSEVEKPTYTKKFKEKMLEWGDRLMVRHDPDTPYFEDLERWLRDIMGHGEKLPDIIIIDTLQSMFIKGSQRWGQFEEMMVRLEKLAKDMNAVVIITAQENTNRMKERREQVLQSDTGGSIAIQQKSAVTIFITDKKIAGLEDIEESAVMQLQIPKNRITGDAFLLNPPLVRYNDNTKSYEEYEPIDISIYESDKFLDTLLEDNPYDI